jgi:CheY-like chemotaxis protein
MEAVMRSPQQKPTRVLVVDQNPMSRQLTAEHLQATGYDVVSAATGERALVLLREWPRRTDWLCTVVELPGLVDGWILADEYHQTHPSRPVIYADGKSVERRAKPHAIFLQRLASPMAVLRVLRQAEALSAQPSIVLSQEEERELGIAA